ncbi:hypothetical protein RED65_12534 [Oceanobacter sp. RED65]|uniref:TonB C-terminal domain-containing protein n=2 Tax=Bermanella marisrubri TaxID=207949 RepID=Q1N3H6_9GAMM|nr:hypothetical protein RED65_12534 [Oceanobacter sp. RED65] [Bermanella marisrubri]
MGVGLYSDLSAKYYYGALYSTYNSTNENKLLDSKSDMRMEMRFISEKVSPRRFNKLFNDMIAINNPTKTINQYTDEIIDLTQIVQDDLIYGDRLVVERINGGVTFFINSVPVMTTDNSEFLNVLLRGWIGLLPPTPSYKRDVLSGDTGPHVLAYETLDWDSSRKTLVEKWQTPIRSQSLEAEQLRLEKQQFEKEQEALTLARIAVEKLEKKAKSQALDKVEKQRKLAMQKERERQLEKKREENERKRRQRLAALKEKQEEERQRLKEIQLAENIYYKQVLRKAMDAVVYPRRAYERGQEGLVKVRINIDKDGNVKNAVMIQSSKINILDAAAVMSAKKAQPYPKVPVLLANNQTDFEFTIPYRFKTQ